METLLFIFLVQRLGAIMTWSACGETHGW